MQIILQKRTPTDSDLCVPPVPSARLATDRAPGSQQAKQPAGRWCLSACDPGASSISISRVPVDYRFPGPTGPSKRDALGRESRGQRSPDGFTYFLGLRTALNRGSWSLLSLAGQAPAHRRDVGTEISGVMPCHHLQSCSPSSHGIWASIADSPASSCFLPLLP